MSHSSDVRAPGLGRLLRDLLHFGDEVADTSAPDLEARQAVATAIATNAPRRSGRLAGSVRPDATGVEITAPYAGPIAYGWPAHGIEAHPFVETGLAAASERAVAAYDKHVGDALDVFHRSY